MTDKQIIIDGVDVSGCAFYGFSNLNNHLCRSEEFSKIDCTYCNNNPNCYYKQLKRKEQECEAYKMEAEEGKEINAELKAENEGLKKYIKHLHNLCGSETDKQYKLKQTLTEIKEIAETCMQQEVCFACDYYDNCYIEDEEIPTYDVCKVILQKISEVEDVS